MSIILQSCTEGSVQIKHGYIIKNKRRKVSRRALLLVNVFSRHQEKRIKSRNVFLYW